MLYFPLSSTLHNQVAVPRYYHPLSASAVLIALFPLIYTITLSAFGFPRRISRKEDLSVSYSTKPFYFRHLVLWVFQCSRTALTHNTRVFPFHKLGSSASSLPPFMRYNNPACQAGCCPRFVISLIDSLS